MHQTTVRFGENLWDALEVEASRLGISVAQYVRDAALSRLSYEAGRRDEQEEHGREPSEQRGEHVDATLAQEHAQSEVSESSALWAQADLARRRAIAIREQSTRARAKYAESYKT